MLLNLLKKHLVLIYLILVGLSIASCSEYSDVDCEYYDYHDCDTKEPSNLELNLYFTINQEIQSVPFEIYQGTVDEGTLLLRDTAYDHEVVYSMPVPNTYSVRAIYSKQDRTIYVVDGDKMKAKSQVRCDSTCWESTVYKFDLMIH